MSEDNEEPPDDNLVAFAAEVRHVGAEIIAAVEAGDLDQAKALAAYLCMAAALIEQAGTESEELDPYDLARLKLYRDDGASESGN